MSSGYAEMTLEEFEEVMDLEEIEFWKEESDAAKRLVENSATNSNKPSERRKGF